MKASGEYAMHLENTWVDNMHAGVFQDAAHSMSALGMLAPLVETLMTAIFRAIGREKLVAVADLKELRSKLKADELWDPHVVAGIARKGKRKGELTKSTDILRGTVQLAELTGLEVHLPANWQVRMEALFRYRNRMFHNGFEWSVDERAKFDEDVAGWPDGWFLKSERGTSKKGIMEPWIFYMSADFIRDTLKMAENRTALAGVSSRIDVLEAQLVRGKRQIDEQTIDRFGEMLREKMRGEDNTLRSAYIKLFVSEVRVLPDEIVISGPVSALENGVAVGLPVKEGAVPIFDREWCPEEDSNLHDLAIAST